MGRLRDMFAKRTRAQADGTPGMHDELLASGPHEQVGDDEDLVLAQLRALGADLSQPRDVRHYLYFANEASADAAARELRELGYNVEVGPAAGADEPAPNPWCVLASAERVADERTVPLETTRMTTVATKLAGEYDGWEAAL